MPPLALLIYQETMLEMDSPHPEMLLCQEVCLRHSQFFLSWKTSSIQFMWSTRESNKQSLLNWITWMMVQKALHSFILSIELLFLLLFFFLSICIIPSQIPIYSLLFSLSPLFLFCFTLNFFFLFCFVYFENINIALNDSLLLCEQHFRESVGLRNAIW